MPGERPMNRLSILLSLLALAGVVAVSASPTEGGQAQRVSMPAEMGEEWIPARRAAQLESVPQFEVFHGFRFVNSVGKSGITFHHQIVADAGADYKPVHYDHGNGLAAADVDGDGLMDLYFLTQLGGNELWKNLGDGRFRDITAEAGVALADRVSVAASFADVDNDGDPDLFVTTVRHGNTLFENLGQGRFRDIGREAGLDHVGHSSAGHFFDYDNDGLVDLFLSNVGVYTTEALGPGGYYVGMSDAFSGHRFPDRAERSILYRNLGRRRFRNVSEEVLLSDRSWTGDSTMVDFNGDRYPDLYVLNMQGADHYYENVGGRFFVDRTDRLFPQTPPGSMGVKVFDWNNDGRMDLLVTDMHSDMVENVGPDQEKRKSITPREFLGSDEHIFGNAFWENTGEGFREISDRVQLENYWPWGVSVDDLNADGWNDVFITASMNFPFRYGVNSVLLNNRGETFLDSEFILGVEPRDELVKPWITLDCPERPASGGEGETASLDWITFGDARAATPSGDAGEPRVHPGCRGRVGEVTILAARGSRSSVVFDLDGDGDLDIVTNEFFDRPQVLISSLAQERDVNYLKVRLVGTRSNRSGLGCRVRVVTADGSQIKVHDGKSGYLSQSQIPLYFGLGEAKAVELIEVAWPSGVTQTLRPAGINRLLEITEPSEIP
jgi:hypothetical protein